MQNSFSQNNWGHVHKYLKVSHTVMPPNMPSDMIPPDMLPLDMHQNLQGIETGSRLRNLSRISNVMSIKTDVTLILLFYFFR